MLTSQSYSEPEVGQGRPTMDYAEMRACLANPSAMSDGDRQRLLELTRRLARIRALGGEYARVEISPWVEDALMNEPVAV